MSKMHHDASDIDRTIEALKKEIDRTLIRENLKRSVQERLLNLMELQRFAEDIRKAGKSRGL